MPRAAMNLNSIKNLALGAIGKFREGPWPARLREGPRFSKWERIIGRVLFAAVVWNMFDPLTAQVMSIASQPDPVGMAHFLDLTFFANRELLGNLKIVLMVGLMFYVMGRGLPIVLPVVWFVVIGPATLMQSQGADNHHLQTAALVLTGQMIWSVIWGIRWLLPAKGGRPKHSEEFFRQLMWISLQIIVATYVTTGVTKMWDSDFKWVKNAKNFPIQLEKTRMSEYYNRLKDPEIIDVQADEEKSGLRRMQARTDAWFARLSKSIENFLIQSPTWSRVFMTAGLLLEFAACLALLGRRWALVIGLALIGFHLTISRVMSLHFELNMQILAVFLVNPAYWLVLPFCRKCRESAE